MRPSKKSKIDNPQINDLDKNTESGQGQFLTTNQGLRINDDQNSLKAGERGSTLLEDFQLREKIRHLDHERIPERIVHARGSGAHGYFELSESMSQYTKAKFLQNSGTRIPVFARFSTVAGSRGSSDLARDLRGFAVKFYTEEGNNPGQSSYHPNTIGEGCPFQAKATEGGFVSYNERIDSRKVRTHNKSFFDHFSKAKLFFNSQTEAEKNHIVNTFCFELGKLKTAAIRERVTGMSTKVDKILSARVAEGLGIQVPQSVQNLNQNIPADGDPKDFQSTIVHPELKIFKRLSMAGTVKYSIKTRQIAILVADGVDENSLNTMKQRLEDAGAQTKIIARHLGSITSGSGTRIMVDQSFLTAASVLFDAGYVPKSILINSKILL